MINYGCFNKSVFDVNQFQNISLKLLCLMEIENPFISLVNVNLMTCKEIKMFES